jgi:DNA-binding transcriptional regulator YdaS (Cro superfamily)
MAGMTLRERLQSMKQAKAAKFIKGSRPYVSQVISGERVMSPERFVAVGDKLKMSDEDLGRSLRECVRLNRKAKRRRVRRAELALAASHTQPAEV